MNMRLNGSVSFRPVRIGFLMPPDDLGAVSKVARLSTCLWGGRYNVMIPFFQAGGERWVQPYHAEGGLDVARGYVNFFEPDILVESTPGMAERLGWHGENHQAFGLPRVLLVDDFYKQNHQGRAEFVAGVDSVEVMLQLYDDEYKYERRHKRPFAVVGDIAGNAFFDVVGGRYPSDAIFADTRTMYAQVFSPETLPPSAESAMKIIKEGYVGPIWVTRQGLEESSGRGSHDQSFYVFDPTDAADVIDYWNYRLIERRVIPISLEWFVDHKDFIRERILQMHRPIPGNPFGAQFYTSLHFASSISDETAKELMRKHLNDLPEMSFVWGRGPVIWQETDRGYERRETKVLATSKAIAFDEEINSEGYVRLPAPSPTFLNSSRRFTQARWVNLILPTPSLQDDDSAIVYPSNVWSPDYPRLAAGENLRIGREGWALQQQFAIGFSLLRPQGGREAIIGWLKTRGIEAQPSEEGQVAAQVIAAAGGLVASGMFADRKTIDLLSEMAESRTNLSRSGKRVTAITPDRSKHINTVRHHFDERAKRSFGFWNGLDYFLKRSVFRAGLRVRCPICGYHNWFDLDAISYSPTCTRCLKPFKFSQSPEALHDVNWFYRIVGPFAAPDYARGGYAVALTLRCIAGHREAEMTWTTGLKLQSPLDCELDFIAWHRPSKLSNDERDEPLLVIGEAKSFGKNAINEDVIVGLKKAATHFPGAVMVVSSLREISEYTPDEIRRLRELALWGRQEVYKGQPRNPLVILTGTELFAQHGIFDAWKDKDGKREGRSVSPADLHALAELTVKKYLGLPNYWEERMMAISLAHQRHRLIKLVRTRARVFR